MRALHIYSGNRFGGIERLLVTLARLRNFAPEMESQFALFYSGMLSEKLKKNGVTVALLGAVRMSRPWTTWKARRKLKKLLNDTAPNIVVCHEYWAYSIAAPVARALTIPLVLWHHGFMDGYYSARVVKRFPPDRVISCSQCVADKVEERVGYPHSLISVYYAPIEPPPPDSHLNRNRIRKSLGIQDHERVILHVGRLSSYKGQKELLEAFNQLLDLPLRIWFVGHPQTGEETVFYDSLKLYCKSNGFNERVAFLGHQDDIYDYYFAADLYCQPNRSAEPYGFTFVEALFANLPVVSTDIGGAREILKSADSRESYGTLVPPGNSQFLARALRELIKDPQKLRAFSSLSEKRAKELGDPERKLKELSALLQTVVKSTAVSASSLS